MPDASRPPEGELSNEGDQTSSGEDKLDTSGESLNGRSPSAAEYPAPSSTEADLKDGASQQTELLRSAGIVGFMTILSRILGLWRDRLMAGLFGATYLNDAFQLAFILPNLTRRLFGEGALASAFIPVFSERLATGNKEKAFKTASVLLSRLATGLLFLCLILTGLSLAVRHVIDLPPHYDLTLRLAEIMIGYCVVINIAAVLMGVLNALRHFTAPAFAPLLLNVCMISACLFGGKVIGRIGLEDSSESLITVVSLAVMAGGVLQLLIMLPPAFIRGFRYSPSINREDEGYQEVMKGFGPVVLGVALFQINILLDQLIARVLIPENGPVTMLAYGNRLIQLPWAIFSLALATAALPMLSRFWASKKQDEFSDAISTTLRNTLFLAAPSAVGLCLLSTDLVRLLYGTGEFLAGDADAVVRTGRVVSLLSLGLCFYSVNAILARALYATKDTRTPTRSAILAVSVNITLNLVLVLGTDMKEAGLALASAISGACQTTFMALALIKKLGDPDTQRLRSFLNLIGGAAVVGAVGAVAVYRRYGSSQDIEGFISYAVAAAFALLPIFFAGRVYFTQQLKILFPDEVEKGKGNEDWSKLNLPRDLVFYYSLYTTTMICIVMGMLVWAVRDSLPPGEGSTALVFQRGVVPVAIGFSIFVVAAGTFQSHEYEEIKTAFARKLGKGRPQSK